MRIWSLLAYTDDSRAIEIVLGIVTDDHQVENYIYAEHEMT
jgi:hypothetical protein